MFGLNYRKEGFDGNEADSWVVEALDMPKESAHKVFVKMHKREQEVSMSSREVNMSFHRFISMELLKFSL